MRNLIKFIIDCKYLNFKLIISFLFSSSRVKFNFKWTNGPIVVLDSVFNFYLSNFEFIFQFSQRIYY